MRKLMTGLALAICAVGFAPAAIRGTGAALAQTEPSGSIYEGLKQAALTEPLIKQYIAAQKDMEAVFADAPAEAADKPDPKTLARLEAVAKKNHFASYEEFNAVAGNIALVLDGIDPKTKKYVGAEVVLKQTIAETQADAKMTPADKKEALDEMNNELKEVIPLKYPANIDLVLKYYDALAGAEPQAK
jgi:hypothetical protein